jgi:hypothetical protein
MQTDPAKLKQDIDRTNPDLNQTLGIAKVVNVNYEEMFVTLRTLLGSSQTFERVPVPLTFPGAGNRQFLGSLPMVGDFCIIGWLRQESRGTKTPIILSWMLPGIWPARDWATTVGFELDEFDLDVPRDRSQMVGAHDRIRHKLRHMHPGNIVASSAQGADLVLDESVLLTNRRGNEIRLRDQDQATIFRSLQQFHAMAGTRIYAGMVQRDATFLSPTMVSDGKEWDSLQQTVLGVPLNSRGLPADPRVQEGFLTPAEALARVAATAEEGYLSRPLIVTNPEIDPYNFLRRGGFIDESGYVVDNRWKADAIYGGKAIYRVASQSTKNAVLDSDQPTLTEYRIELTHTSDGRLPVTEQTDGFDAERLPKQNANQSAGNNTPFLQWVLGSVVGNDPYSQKGKREYGLPLRATIFDGDQPVPRLEPAMMVPEGLGVNPTPLKDQLASLFSLTPPLSVSGAGTFWGVNKQGQLRASIGGNAKENSAEVYLHGGLKLGVGGKFQMLMNGHVEFGTLSKSSLNLTAAEGPVRIYGGGPLKDQSAPVERFNGNEGDLPAVDIEAKTNVRIKGGRKIQLKASTVETDASTVSVVGHDSVSIDGVKKATISSENYQLQVNGKAQESYGGPKYGLPTNAPLKDVTFAPLYPGIVCEKTTFVMGDREDLFLLGNHKTSVLIGNLTYETALGIWTARATTSQLNLSAAGITGTAAAGAVTLTAVAGVATMTGLAAASLISTGGVATVRGTAGVYLGGPLFGTDMGPILCSGTLEPLTGLPFGTWGCGAKGHLIGV